MGEAGGQNEKWDRSLVRATSEVTAILMSLLQANPSNPLLREDASLPSQVAVHHVQKTKQQQVPRFLTPAAAAYFATFNLTWRENFLFFFFLLAGVSVPLSLFQSFTAHCLRGVRAGDYMQHQLCGHIP